MAVHITHVMADGSVRQSMEGFVIPVTQVTKPAYEIMLQMALQGSKQEERHETLNASAE